MVEVSPLLSVAHAEHRQIDEQLAGVLRAERRGDQVQLAEQVALLRATLLAPGAGARRRAPRGAG